MTPFAIRHSGKKAQDIVDLRAEELAHVGGGMMAECKTITICENEGPNCPKTQCDTGD